jgi:hypothetical protein
MVKNYPFMGNEIPLLFTNELTRYWGTPTGGNKRIPLSDAPTVKI